VVEIELADSSDSLSSEVRCWPRFSVDVAVNVENISSVLEKRESTELLAHPPNSFPVSQAKIVGSFAYESPV